MDATQTYQKNKRKSLLILLSLGAVAALLLGLGLVQFSGRGPNYRGEYWSLWDYMMDPFSFTPGLMIDVGLLMLVCVGIWYHFNTKRLAKEHEDRLAEEQREQAARQQAEERNRILASGTWDFPALEFVRRCEKAGVANLESSFFLSKAQKIAATLLTEHKVAEKFHNLYSSEERIRSYWAHGRNQLNLEKQEKERAREELHRTPQQAKLTDEERSHIEAARDALSQAGIEKRRVALWKQITALEKKIADKEAGAKALRDLGGIIATSAYEEKPKDWATLGGIASGIAGPAAGVATAVNAMAENQRIEARNAQNRAAVGKMSMEMYNSSWSVEQDIPGLRSQVTRLRREVKELEEKVVLSVPSAELRKALIMESVGCVKTESGAVEVVVTFRNDYVPDVPAGVRIVTDGVLTADVNCDGIRVGEVLLPLPVSGIECGATAEVKGFCPQGMVGSRRYTVAFRSANLWAMER